MTSGVAATTISEVAVTSRSDRGYASLVSFFRILGIFCIYGFAAGCSDPSYDLVSRSHVPEAKRPEMAAFIIECARAANPHSDEEGEDLVAQCERTGHRLFATSRTRICIRDRFHEDEIEWPCGRGPAECQRVCRSGGER
jgi:hypothetical protein